MAVRCLLVVLVSVLFGTPQVQGTLSFSLMDYTTNIPTDGSGRILITDIGSDNDNALICRTNTPNPGNGDYYLHPSMVTTSNSDRIESTDSRGWTRNRDQVNTLARLRRHSTSWTEGVFTCQFSGISDPPISVGVYYPITAVSVSINVVSARLRTYTVTCTTTGGTVLSGSLTEPDGMSITNFSPVGSRNYRGQDSYRASTGTRTGGNDGAIYRCTATNGVPSPDGSGSATLRVAGPPTMVSAQQVAPGSSISVTWVAPSGGATVTGYTVHYSGGGDTGSVNVGSSTTTTTITGRINDGRTYTITVEARSMNLSGESTTTPVTLVAPPNPPSNVRVTNIQPHSVNLMWDTQSGVASYTVQYTQTQGDDQLGNCRDATHSGSVSTTGASTSIPVQGSGNDMLRAFTTYSITVTAVSVTSFLGSSGPSTAVVVTTAQTGATSSPSNVKVTAESSSSIRVEWGPIQPCRDRNGNINNYNIKYQPVGGSGSVKNEIVSGVGSAGGQVLLDRLTSFTNYSIQVAAVNNQSIVGTFSTAVTGHTFLGPVTNLKPMEDLLQINLTWVAPTGPSGAITTYEVSYQLSSSSVGGMKENTTNKAHRVTGLKRGTSYSITVRAFSQAGAGDSTSITTTTLSKPPTVQGVVVSRLNSTTVRVTWQAVQTAANLTGYTVFYSQETTSRRRQVTAEMNETFPSSAASGTISGLEASKTYKFQVTASVNVNGEELVGDRSALNDNSRVDLEGDTNSGGNEGGGGGSNIGAIIGGVIVAIVVVLIVVGIIVVLVWLTKCKGPSSTTYKPATDDPSLELNSVRYAKTPVQSANGSSLAPEIVSFPEYTHAEEGETVFFQVKVLGTPQPELTWYHNGDVVVADYSRELAEDGSLNLPSVEDRHTGTYKLVAQNSAGRREKEVELFVRVEGAAPTPQVSSKQVHLSTIPVEQFGQFVVSSHSNNNQDFKDQYTTVDQPTGQPVDIGSSLTNKPLNRFANITVYDSNRITLRPLEGHADCQRDFVNACYVDGYKFRNRFIATQGPLPKTLVDFWRLVWQEKPPTIVMVTNLKENNKVKCQQYWPESGTKSFGPFQVSISDQQPFADYVIRTLSVNLSGSSERPLKVTQFHFTAWPDHGVPDYATPILAFHRRVKKEHRPSKGPMLLHCSAGVGRTGTLITIDRVLDQISKEKLVDIAGTITMIRRQRMKLVQTQDQYIFLHDAILEAITCGDTQIMASDLRVTIQKMSRCDPKTRMTGFEGQFKVLDQVTPNPHEVKCSVALQNPTKNRSNEFLPSNKYRVVLKGEFDDYINGSIVNGYKHQRAFIIAQGPMESTARDFWKMVHDKKCGVIVMLSDLVEGGQEVCHRYWPSSGVVKIKEYTIDLLGEEAMQGFVLRTLSVLHSPSGKAQQVSQFHITNWTPDGSCSNLKTVTDVIDEVGKVQRRTGNRPIVVHCSDTVSRSGMFCAMATTIERCKTEGVVDVFQVVKALRVQKPGAVHTVTQFRSIFDAVLVYLDSFDTYANFQDL